MRLVHALLAAVAVVAAAGPAAAVQYRFDVFDPGVTQSGQQIDNNIYTFYLESTYVNPSHDSGSFTVSGGARSDYTTVPSDITFFTDPTGQGYGGLQTQFDVYDGPQLFTGSTANPTFKTGPFTLDSGRSITISAPTAAAVPEPASWATMVAGFGLAGSAFRVRRRATAAA